MKLLKSTFVATILLTATLLSCSKKEVPHRPLPNDIRWVTQSDEYKSLCLQTYRMAWRSVKSMCETVQAPVIVMDLDETVLANAEYQVSLFLNAETFRPDTWHAFVRKEISKLIPGAKTFITNYKKNKHARIVYISNRSAKTLKATIGNMKKLGVYFENDVFLLRKNREDTKAVRRNEVFKGIGRMQEYGPQKVMAYFGDAMGDFPKDDKYYFSVNNFIFPNPMYGKW